VNHPNVIKLYSVGYDQGYFYIAMELVDGGNLEQRIRREGRVTEADALRIGLEVAEGLRAAQQMGLIHRDVKPANILFTETGTAKVVDFGLAIFVDRGGDNSGEIWATPYYVAPEKVLDNREDYRSDIFSLGATLYHAMTGKPPHKADTDSIEQLRMIKCRRVALEDSGARFAPRTLHAINRMLAFRPQERCANYDETVDELRLAEGLLGQSYATRWRLTSRRMRWAMTAAALLVVAFVIGWLVQFSGMRQAAAITQKVDTSRIDLSGEGVMLQASN
jgi:serine/threonine protein kinase